MNVHHSPAEETTCTIFDGAAIVNMLRPHTAKTFQDFLSYITSRLQHATRLDIVWDKYVSHSLKADARGKRGKGVRRHVMLSHQVQFLEIGLHFSELLTTNLSCSPIWLQWQSALILASR